MLNVICFLNNFTEDGNYLFRTMKGIYLGHRMKTPSQVSLNRSEVMNTSADQSRGDSSSKRFSRKQGHQLQNSRTCKTPKIVDQTIKKHLEQNKVTKEKKPTAYISSGFIRQEDLFLKISHTPSKGALFTPPISTDRITESTALTKPNEMQTAFNTPSTKKKQFPDLQEELQLRNGEIMMLEDQNCRLKGEIQNLESQHLKLRLNQQKQYQQTIKKLQDELQKLKTELSDKNELLKKMHKTEGNLTRELKGVKYEKLLLEKQLEEIYKKRLPKEFRDLMSYRQVSLMNQVEELRKELQKEKSQKERLMEIQLTVLKQKHIEKESTLKKLQIHSHMLNKKVIDTEESLKAQQEQYSQCFSNMQLTNTSLVDQLKRTRKQNLKLQRLHILTSQQGRRKPNNMASDDSDSFSISVSPRSPREL